MPAGSATRRPLLSLPTRSRRAGLQVHQNPGPIRPGVSGALFLSLLITGAALIDAAPASGSGTERVTTTGQPTAKRAKPTFSFRPWLSANGRYIAFDTDAALVDGDTNRLRDVYLYDRDQGEATLVSRGTAGRAADGESQRPTLSADGRVVAFWSVATNLVNDDTNGVSDAFVFDVASGSVQRASVGPGGAQANGPSARPVISADGRSVAFESAASNLVQDPVLPRSGDSNKARDIFVVDLGTGEVIRASVDANGNQAGGESVRPSISGDGRFVAFQTDAILDPADTNMHRDVYMHDRATGKTALISTGPGGVAGDGGSFSPSLSADGRLVAFWSNARNLIGSDGNRASDVFVRDLVAGTTERVSIRPYGAAADGLSSDPSISPDGRFVSFWSEATNLVDGDTNGRIDVFLVDRTGPTLQRASVASDGAEGDADSYSPNVINGGLVAFDSRANTLVPDDYNSGSDIFIHSLPAP